MVEWGAEKEARTKLYKAPNIGGPKDEKGLSDIEINLILSVSSLVSYAFSSFFCILLREGGEKREDKTKQEGRKSVSQVLSTSYLGQHARQITCNLHLHPCYLNPIILLYK